MRRLFLLVLLFCGVFAAFASANAGAVDVRSHKTHSHRTSRSRHAQPGPAVVSGSPATHIAPATHHSRSRGRPAPAHVARVSSREKKRVRPHTAQALHRARRHGTDAVRAAARQSAIESARSESPSEQPQETASLRVPEQPLRSMNLPPLRGSHESLVRQNQRAEQDGLLRIRDDEDIESLRRLGSLVSLPSIGGLRVDDRLPLNRRYCRAWTGHFLSDLARVHYGRFGTELQVNSAVRTIEYQRHLLHINGNAAPAEGDVASPHLTGAAVDISKKGLSPSEIAWLRAYLLPLQTAGKIDVEEEFHQACFHISVYKTYMPGLIPSTPLISASPSHATAIIASGLR
jgi:hypothetical protein